MAINKEFRVKHGLISEDDVQVNGNVTADAFIGDGSQLTGVSSFSGNYNDLTNKPTIPSDVNQLTDNMNVLFSGNYNDLTNQPALFSGNYNDLNNLPNLIKAAVEWSPNHTLADGTRYLAGDVVYDNGNIYVANYDNESLPTSNTTYWTNLGPGNRLNIDGRDIPNISYTQLSNIPTDLATQGYVNTQIANLVDSSPTTLDTLNELAAALGDDPNFATTVSTQIGLKANTADLSNVAFNGVIDSLDDVVISSPTATHYLKFDGTNWINSPVSSIADITNGGISTPTFVQFDTLNIPTITPTGQVSWNESDGTLDVGLLGGNVVLQVGQEQVQRIYNNTGATLLESQAVVIAGAQGQRLTVGLAQANAESTSSKTFGVVTESILNEGEGYICTEGMVRNINTSAFPQGAALWLSPTTPGGITTTKPVAPNHLVLIGFCVNQHPTAGSIFVKVQNGYELDELHDVLINSKANNDVLKYDSATGVWKNAQFSYNNLIDKPTIATDVSQLTDNAGVLFSGNYNDLTSKPAITPTAVSDQDNTSTGYFDLPSGTTAQRPGAPTFGMIRANTTTGYPEWYDSASATWVNFNTAPPYSIQYLVIAGGGAGGMAGPGGGGAGGYRSSVIGESSGGGASAESPLTVTPGTSYTVIVGGGGASGPNPGSSGSNSTFGSITSIGGGGGGGNDGGTLPTSGGSGGGGSYNDPGASGTTGQGYAGGSGTGGSNSGGGGGAGSVGQNNNGSGGSGGSGVSSSISGSTITRAGGGGGYQTGAGGSGGGGAYPGVSGTTNTGSGGGGNGGSGGSGIVIVRYLGAQRGTGGNVTSSNGYTIHTFTSSGTFTA